MARPKSFSPEKVLGLAQTCFTAGGYEGTSIDDLVQALDLHRGSLYKAFGSKRGLFLAVLEEYLRATLPTAIAAATNSAEGPIEYLTAGSHLDLLLVAAVERGHSDIQVAALVGKALVQLDRVPGSGADSRPEERRSTAILGARLYRRLLPAAGEPLVATSMKEGY